MKKILRVLLYVVLAIILLFGVWSGYGIYTTRTHKAVSKWFVFENKEFGIQFKYPQDVFINVDTQVKQDSSVDAKAISNHNFSEPPDYRESYKIFFANGRGYKPSHSSIDGGITAPWGSTMEVTVVDIPFENYPHSNLLPNVLNPTSVGHNRCINSSQYGETYYAYKPMSNRTVVMEINSCGLQKKAIEDIVASVKAL